MDIKLIPKEYKPEDKSQKGFDKILQSSPWLVKILSSRIFIYLQQKAQIVFIFCLVLMIISFLVVGGFFGWQQIMLSKEKTNLDQEINQLNAQRDLVLEKKIPNLSRLLALLTFLLNDRAYPTNVFKMLENLTVSKVQFLTFSTDFLQNRLSLSGQAFSFGTMLEQFNVFKDDNQKRIKKVDISNTNLNINGQVSFRFEIILDPQFLKCATNFLEGKCVK